MHINYSKLCLLFLIFSPSVHGGFEQDLEQLSHALGKFSPHNSQQRYYHYKAKMWLSYAKHEWSEKGLSLAKYEAFDEARKIHLALTNQQPLSDSTHILTNAQVMRRDLWLQLAYLKQSNAMQLLPETIAHAEVQLVWGAAEYCELGWRHAKPHFFAAQQAIRRSLKSIDVDIIPQHDDLPSLLQLNQKGCEGVNTTFWPLSYSPKIPPRLSTHDALSPEVSH